MGGLERGFEIHSDHPQGCWLARSWHQAPQWWAPGTDRGRLRPGRIFFGGIV